MPTLEELAQEASSAMLNMDAIFGSPELPGGGRPQDRRQRRVIYWRKSDHEGAPDAGWITTGPESRTDNPRWQRFRDRGWVPLEKFGNQISGQNILAQGKSTPMIWEATKQQRDKPTIWLKTFFENGGLTYVISPTDGYGRAGDYLIPATQLVSLGLHTNPEVVRVRPDLQKAVILTCPERCVEENGSPRIFSGINQGAAQAALDMHFSVKHKASEGTRSVGQEIANALEKAGGLRSGTDDIAAVVAGVLAALGHAVPQEKKPAGPKFPEGFPDETWKRQELMAYATAHNIDVTGLGDAGERMKKDTKTWLDYVVSMVTRTPEDSEPDLEELFLQT